jgi:hypothetical protein
MLHCGIVMPSLHLSNANYQMNDRSQKVAPNSCVWLTLTSASMPLDALLRQGHVRDKTPRSVVIDAQASHLHG